MHLDSGQQDNEKLKIANEAFDNSTLNKDESAVTFKLEIRKQKT